MTCTISTVLETELGKELGVYELLVYTAHPCNTEVAELSIHPNRACQVYQIPVTGKKSGSQPYVMNLVLRHQLPHP